MLSVCRTELQRVKVVLASQSPRRKELMASLGLEFETLPSGFSEDLDKSKYDDAADYAADTAYFKVEDVARTIQKREEGFISPYLIVGADTVVDLAGEVMEKPDTEEDAFRMLSTLSGNTHRVHTGVAVCLVRSESEPTKVSKHSETTTVTFDDLPEKVIRAYIASGEPMDKAGSYGIQGSGGSMVTGIQGCYFNVMGLPLNRLSKIIANVLREE